MPQCQNSLEMINLVEIVHRAFVDYEKNVSDQIHMARMLAIQDRNKLGTIFNNQKDKVSSIEDLITGCLETTESEIKSLDKFIFNLPGFLGSSFSSRSELLSLNKHCIFSMFTIKSYKLYDRKNNELYALFLNGTQLSLKWLEAIFGQEIKTQTILMHLVLHDLSIKDEELALVIVFILLFSGKFKFCLKLYARFNAIFFIYYFS